MVLRGAGGAAPRLDRRGQGERAGAGRRRQVAAFGLLSEAFLIASTMMAALGKTNIGYVGLIRAQEVADQAGDELLQAMNVSALCARSGEDICRDCVD
jgi:hypothetical protein